MTCNGEALDLTALEYRALAYFMLDAVYGYNEDRDSNVIEVLVNRLRKKIGASLIHTRRGQGYELSEVRDGGNRALRCIRG